MAFLPNLKVNIIYIILIVAVFGFARTLVKEGSKKPLDDSFTAEKTEGSFGPYTVPKDSYFVMGDNRNCSYDSRFWDNTYVRFDEILGKAVFRYYPGFKLIK